MVRTGGTFGEPATASDFTRRLRSPPYHLTTSAQQAPPFPCYRRAQLLSSPAPVSGFRRRNAAASVRLFVRRRPRASPLRPNGTKPLRGARSRARAPPPPRPSLSASPTASLVLLPFASFVHIHMSYTRPAASRTPLRRRTCGIFIF